MSVTFMMEGYRCDCENPFECASCSKLTMNLCNENAGDLLDWLGITSGLWEAEPFNAVTLAALCRRRLWPEPRNQDPGREPMINGQRLEFRPDPNAEAVTKARLVDCGRRPGYLNRATARLLVIAEAAIREGRKITWG